MSFWHTFLPGGTVRIKRLTPMLNVMGTSSGPGRKPVSIQPLSAN
jgi:hypothetical protein